MMLTRIIFIFCLAQSFLARAENQLVSKNTDLEIELNKIAGQEGNEIRYGYDVLTNTAKYFGPKGKIGQYTTSRVSCSQCHMEAGNRVFGNSFLDTQSIYPQYRSREGEIQTLAERLNACFMHPLLGKKPWNQNGREMKALMMYIKWVGRGRPILETDPNQRLMNLSFLERAANPKEGQLVFENNCMSCHGKDGQGQLNGEKNAFIYPPLWGKESFMTGSSMSRMSTLAKFIKPNMPFGRSTKENPTLTDEQTWDVAAYILSKPRPKWVGKVPFALLSEKPFDYPIGPFEDQFTLDQHIYGPFPPIIEFWKNKKKASPMERMGI